MHSVFFEGTDYELNIYRIFGRSTGGPTLMLIGGIQGDEPGGFLSADHYIDISLLKGNLIVVPRANFQSIVLNRRKINADMNRKFAEDHQVTYETEIVAILKQLISESDCLLNLHDGSGYYSEKWESKDRNPDRYGQSIIADTDRYPIPGTDRVLDLGGLGCWVSNRINRQIENPQHRFHFNNHRTSASDSHHKEQRKSATYYALTVCHIPAFGVETSKELPLETKVRHHNLAINAFMDRLGIVPETPGLNLKPPALKYLVVTVNDRLPVVVENQQTLFVSPGDVVTISHIEANYERGLTADVVGVGSINDVRKSLAIHQATRVVVRKDLYPCGSIYLDLGGETLAGGAVAIGDKTEKLPGSLFFKVAHGGSARYFPNFGTMRLVRGDLIELLDVVTAGGDPSELVVNFKGFVGNVANNTGEDRGQVIDTGRNLWPRYALDPEGKQYQVVATRDEKPVGRLVVDLQDPVLQYLLLEAAGGRRLCLKPGETAQLACGEDRIRMVDVVGNVSLEPKLKATVNREGWRSPRDLTRTEWIDLVDGGVDTGRSRGTMAQIDIYRGDQAVATVFLRPEQERECER